MRAVGVRWRVNDSWKERHGLVEALHGCLRSAGATLDCRRSAGWRKATRHAGNDDMGDAIEVVWIGGVKRR